MKSDIDFEGLAKAIGGLDRWAKNCHAQSLAIVRSGFLPSTARVARGFYPGIGSQHSWVVLGDPYSAHTPIIDGTLWSYTDEAPRFVTGHNYSLPHTPHGSGTSIRDLGETKGPLIELPGLSKPARDFLAKHAPNGLGIINWHHLANSCVEGWPSGEIIDAMYRHKTLRALIPIDIVGMLTEHNPGGLYR